MFQSHSMTAFHCVCRPSLLSLFIPLFIPLLVLTALPQ
jgi:hypothetical protein